MKKQLKNYKKLDEQLKNDIKNSGITADDFKIGIYINNNEKIYSEFSSIHRARINRELITYLEDEIKYKSLEKNIIIEVEAQNEDKKFLDTFKELVKSNLIDDIEDLNYALKRNSKMASILLLCGLLVLIFISVFTYMSDHYVFNEFFVIVSWVLIWQFVEMYFFDRPELKYKKIKLMQLYFAGYKYK